MSETQDTPQTESDIVPFMSFSSFRESHRELLKRRRSEKGGDGDESATVRGPEWQAEQVTSRIRSPS